MGDDIAYLGLIINIWHISWAGKYAYPYFFFLAF